MNVGKSTIDKWVRQLREVRSVTMPKATPKFTDNQIMATLKQAEAGTPVHELCRELDNLLQLVSEIWRYGCVIDGSFKRA